MKEARFAVEGFLGYDAERYRLEYFNHHEYYLVDVDTGNRYSMTVALYNIDAKAGEPDVIVLDDNNAQVAELTYVSLYPADAG